ncbi:Unknown protein, partial [Striga hermonthica]
FKELIREKYYPAYYRAEMERQFLALKQGTRTVDEYEREFTRLRAFFPDLVSTEAKRSRRFTDRLLPVVRHNIVGHGVQSYARAVTIAQEVNASIRREANHNPKKMLRRGDCQGYLVSLVSDEPKARTPHDVPIVREFVDVFPDQLPGGPPNWQVEFSIGLIPGAGPVSK